MRLLAENKEERLAVCKDCPFYNAERNKCKKCGCNMTFKTMYAGSKCPIDKWGCKDCEVK